MLRRTLLAAPALLSAASRRPNILWLMTDEQRPDSLPSYGGTAAQLPHLDALARDGVLFRHAYVPSPVCVACRTALFTGKLPLANQVLHNQARLPQQSTYLTWRFSDAGYQTASFGKKHVFGGPTRPPFDLEAGRTTEGIVEPEAYAPQYNPRDFDALNYPGNPAYHLQRRWVLAGKFPVSQDLSAEALNVRDAQQWLAARDTTKPFFLRLSLNAPHTPVVAPEQYLRQVQPERFQIPTPTAAQLAAQPERERRILRQVQGSHLLTPEQLHHARTYYYARCAFADAMCGRLLDWMRQRSLLANTIIAFVADHGAHLGDQGLLQKQTFYDQVATVPYFFHAPNHIARRKRIDTLVEVLGLVPTLLDLAGLPSHSADSPSLASTLKSGKEPPPRRIQSQIAFGYQRWRDDDPQIMIRDGQWKLHCFHDPANPQRFAASRDAALYDLRSDPHETTNLAHHPQHQHHIERLLQ